MTRSFNRFARNVCRNCRLSYPCHVLGHHILIAQTMFTSRYKILSLPHPLSLTPPPSVLGPNIFLSSHTFSDRSLFLILTKVKGKTVYSATWSSRVLQYYFIRRKWRVTLLVVPTAKSVFGKIAEFHWSAAVFPLLYSLILRDVRLWQRCCSKFNTRGI
jgi:hypothetical protein